jgi:2OG-Fe(II) oxygenase superfamily
MQCQFGMNSPVITEKSVRTAHIDKPMKIYNALLYCRADDDDSAGGELILYKFHKTPGFYGNRTALPGRITEVVSVPYSRNTLVLFLNSANSVHGVRPRKPTPHIRRYINFQVELETENFRVPYVNPVSAWIERKLSR